MAEVHVNPTPEQIRAFTEEMPQTRISEFGNTNTQTHVLSRSAASTHVVDRESSGKTMTRAQFDEIAALQDAYIAEHDMIQIDGYIGNDPAMRTAARLLMEKDYANIAGMQQKLYFERERRGRGGRGRAGPGDLHPRLEGPRLSRRPPDRGRPRQLRDARPGLRLLR